MNAPDNARYMRELQKALQDLQISYQRFFLGSENAPPLQEESQFCAKLKRAKDDAVLRKNTALLVFLRSLDARFSAQQRAWKQKTLQVEKGGVKRGALVEKKKG